MLFESQTLYRTRIPNAHHYNPDWKQLLNTKDRTCAIIGRGLYFFYLFFTAAAAYDTQTIYVLKNGNSSFFKPKIPGLYTRVVTDQEQVIVARVRYFNTDLKKPEI